MSRFWGRIIKMVPPFNGTKEQEAENFLSHTWRTVDLEQRFGVAGMSKVVECSVCKVLTDTNAATWPCGQAPEPVEFNEISNTYRRQ